MNVNATVRKGQTKGMHQFCHKLTLIEDGPEEAALLAALNRAMFRGGEISVWVKGEREPRILIFDGVEP